MLIDLWALQQSKNVIVQSGSQFNISSHFHWNMRTRKNTDLSKFTTGPHLLTKILTTWKFIQNWILLNFTISLYDWKMERFWTLKVIVRKIQISDFFLFFSKIFTKFKIFLIHEFDMMVSHPIVRLKIENPCCIMPRYLGSKSGNKVFYWWIFPQFSQKCTKN